MAINIEKDKNDADNSIIKTSFVMHARTHD